MWKILAQYFPKKLEVGVFPSHFIPEWLCSYLISDITDAENASLFNESLSDPNINFLKIKRSGTVI